jgi:hypothetical protein
VPDNVIKFRVAQGDKLLFAKAAADAEMTLSSYLRRAGRMAMTGRMMTLSGVSACETDLTT